MSAIATFHVVDRATAAAIEAAGDPDAAAAVLRSNGRAVGGDDLFPWSGHCMAELLMFLDDRGIPGTDQVAFTAILDDVVAVFGARHRHLRARLDPAAFSAAELVESMASVNCV